jgi:hypothetical protein
MSTGSTSSSTSSCCWNIHHRAPNSREVRTLVACQLSREKSYTRIKVNYGNRSTMEKASWRAGKMAIMYDFVQISNHKIWVKPTFCIAGANQDATSTRRCDLSQDPSKGILGKAWWTGPKFEQNRPAPYRESLTSLWLKRCHWSTLQGLVSFGTVAR